MDQFSKQILEQVKESYSIIADKFSHTRHTEWPIMTKLIDKYVSANNRILDIGCGNGRLTEVLKNKQVKYLGIDNNKELIRAATNLYPDERFMVNDILKLDFKQEFDVVCAFAVLNHLPSKELRIEALKNIFNSLTPGGWLIVTNWNFWRLKKKQKTIWRYKFFERSRGQRNLKFKDIITYFQDTTGKHPLYYHAFTCRELKKLLRQVGFEVAEAYYEKKGAQTHWWQGNNSVLICKK